jgi:hypothetical protein
VPKPPPPVGLTFFHNSGVFHAKGRVTFHYNNASTTATAHIDGGVLGVGYSQIVSNDDYRSMGVPVGLSVPPLTSGDFTAAFDLDFATGNDPFGYDPATDLFCGSGEFWVGFINTAAARIFFTSTSFLPTITAYSVTFDEIRFDYTVVGGSINCGYGTGTCPPCGDPGNVPTGGGLFTTLCATKMTGGVAPPFDWQILGPGLVPDCHGSAGFGGTVPGWLVGNGSDTCNIYVEAPCQDYDPALIGTSAGLYTVIQKISGIGYIAQFNLIYDRRCTSLITGPPGGAPNTSAIEADGPRRWVHVGNNQNISTYNQNFDLVFVGSYPVDQWCKLRYDPRFGALAGLARTYVKDAHGVIIPSTSAIYSVWLSTDGGQTANKISEVSATSSILERDSERNWLLWFTADSTNLVSVQISKDGGQTYAAAVAVHLDTGAQLQAALLDSCQDCRTGGRVGMICSLGSNPAVVGTTAVMVSDDGGLTFRKVV